MMVDYETIANAFIDEMCATVGPSEALERLKEIGVTRDEAKNELYFYDPELSEVYGKEEG